MQSELTERVAMEQATRRVQADLERLRHKLAEYREAQLAPAREALDLMGLTSRACELFLEQPSAD